MNASGAIRADFVRTSRLSFHIGRISQMQSWPGFTAVNHFAYREKCEEERIQATMVYDPFEAEKGPPTDFEVETEARMRAKDKLKRMFTLFPCRNSTWIVAIIFMIGSLGFTINAFFGLLPLVASQITFANETPLAITVTIFIGGTMFTVAGVLDFFGAFNADRGGIKIAKSEGGEQTLLC